MPVTGLLTLTIHYGRRLHCPYCGARLTTRVMGPSEVCEVPQDGSD